MITRYGNIPDSMIEAYLDRLVNKVYKILPMKEEGCSTLDDYIENLLHELIGSEEVVYRFKLNGEFVSLIGTLHYLATNEVSQAQVKSDVFKCLGIVKRIKASLLNGGK